SRVHARLELIEGAVLLRNESSQGTQVGSQRCFQIQILKDQGTFTCGETKFRLNIRIISETVAIDGEEDDTIELESSTAVRNAPREKTKFHSGVTKYQNLRADLIDDDEAPGSLGPSSGRFKAYVKDPARRGRFIFLFVLVVLSVAVWSFAWPLIAGRFTRPESLQTAFLLSLLTVFPCALFYKFLDLNGQVRWFGYLGALAWGASVGAGWALVINSVGGLVDPYSAGGDGTFTNVIVMVPLREELFKGLGLLVLFVCLEDSFDNSLEGLVLGAACGLGFAGVENLIYFDGFLERGEDELIKWGSYRALVLPVSHPLYTAFTGAGFGFCREFMGKKIRVLLPIFGLALAVGLHMAWNGALVGVGLFDGEEESLLKVLAMTLILGGMAFCLFVFLLRLAISREIDLLERWLKPELEQGFVTKEELASYRGLWLRIKFEWAGLKRGWRVFRARRHLRKAQVALAFRKWHLNQGHARRGDLPIDALILDARVRIRDARNTLIALDAA
ncbi:MAG: PrsW family glutamic-type intramembrane protease, partial [Planctomycetota bacterium]|nr:PrsW family glutamic-type intramembrane protease [Planctomycetota bacterium]